MNTFSICARWRANHWDCHLRDTLIDPLYWSPPPSPRGQHSLQIVAFHASIPATGWTFARERWGAPWTRTS